MSKPVSKARLLRLERALRDNLRKRKKIKPSNISSSSFKADTKNVSAFEPSCEPGHDFEKNDTNLPALPEESDKPKN